MDPPTNPALHPVYKERLQVKYLKATRKKPSLDISRWRFLNDVLDDDDTAGVDPRQPSGSRGGLGPVYLNSQPRLKAGEKAKRSVSKEQACFSRQNGAQQKRRERVTAVERKLRQHPLVLYEHYERSMTPESFEQVLSVLDPDMRPQRGAGAPAKLDEDLSKMTRGFQQWDASLSETRSKNTVANVQTKDTATQQSTAAETSAGPGVPEEPQVPNQASTKENREMFAFKAFRQYLLSNRLRVPEFMSKIFSEEEEAEEGWTHAVGRSSCSSISKSTSPKVQ